MSQFLELAQFTHRYGVTKGEVGFGRIESAIDPQGAVFFFCVQQAPARLSRALPESLDALAHLLEGADSSFVTGARERLEKTLGDAETLADLDEAEVKRLESACAPTPLVKVPRFDADVYDVAGLWELDRYLFGP